jgi:bifunctional N-acetylglucosamine-1-phosphate-uridyltransferase/glucosamine-1-phosphate-acetyltransferase GlmU-like protein
MRLLIIPAAGLGTRLGASKPKPLVEVNGRPMLDHLAALYRSFVDETVVVANPAFAADIVAWGRHSGGVSVAVQPSPTGMLDAILLAAPIVREKKPDEIWITWSDQVGVLGETVQRLADVTSADPRPALALPTVARRDPYIHFERDGAGRINRLLQRREGDRMPEQGESDMGLFAMPRQTFELDLQDYARDVPPGSATGERNFLPFVPWLAQRRIVATFPCTDPMEAVGINTPDELQQVEAWLRSRP